MKLLILELCLLSLASHGQLQVSMPTTAAASSFRAEIENLRNFLDEALKVLDSGNGVTLDQETLLSYLTHYTQSLMVKHVSEQETAATTEASITENDSSAPSLDVNSDNTNDDVIENEETTSSVYTTTATQEQSTRDESEYAALGILQGMTSTVYSTTATQEQSTRDKICELPAMTGFCRGYFVKFHFDPTTGLCKKFVYGGCGGNANRFNTEEDCQKRCQP